jgi:hypothetical protein
MSFIEFIQVIVLWCGAPNQSDKNVVNERIQECRTTIYECVKKQPSNEAAKNCILNTSLTK